MPRKKAKLDLTLFPFLSVLAGMIAVMMLFMMLTMGTRVIGDDAVAKKQRAARPKKPPGDAPESLALPSSVADAIDDVRYEQFRQEIVRLSGVLAERKKQHDELVASVDRLEGLVEEKKNEVALAGVTRPRPGRKIGQPTPVDVVPVQGGGGGPSKKAVYFEVNATEYILHPEKRSFPVVTDKGTPAAPSWVVDPALAKVLAEVYREKKQKYIIYLIHPGGTVAWRNLDGYIERTYPDLDVGWEPFARDWLYVSGKK
jgi:hypothetical protein